MILDIFLDALLDTLKAVPFLFAAYLLLEWLEEKGTEKTIRLVYRAGRVGPVIGAALGAIPQCGFSAATANLYTCGIIARGTMLAVFLSTSDEMLPILIAKNAPGGFIALVVLYKVLVGIAVGMLINALDRRKARPDEKTIHDFCEAEHCRCEEEGSILKAALIHTLKIGGFIFAAAFLLGLVIELAGTERISSFILNRPIAGELLAGVIGLIPNCAASVIITELYIQGGISVGAMLAGLLVNAGIGVLVLFRTNRDMKDNLKTLGLLYGSGILFGLLGGLAAGGI